MQGAAESSGLSHSSPRSNTLGERARIAVIGLDCLVALNLVVIAYQSGSAMAEYGQVTKSDPAIGYRVAVLYLIPAVIAVIPAVASWRRWRWRWLLQLVVGSMPIALLLTLYARLILDAPG